MDSEVKIRCMVNHRICSLEAYASVIDVDGDLTLPVDNLANQAVNCATVGYQSEVVDPKAILNVCQLANCRAIDSVRHLLFTHYFRLETITFMH